MYQLLCHLQSKTIHNLPSLCILQTNYMKRMHTGMATCLSVHLSASMGQLGNSSNQGNHDNPNNNGNQGNRGSQGEPNHGSQRNHGKECLLQTGNTCCI